MARVSKKLDEFKSSPFKYIPFEKIKRLDVVNFINPNYPSLNSNSSNNYCGWSGDENYSVNDIKQIAYSKIDKRRLTPGNWFFSVLSATDSSSKISPSTSRIWLYYVFSKEEILSKVNEGIIKKSDYDKMITNGNNKVIYGSIPIFESYKHKIFDKLKYHESDPRTKSIKRYLDEEIVFEDIRLNKNFALLDSRWNSRMLHYHIPPYFFNGDFDFINWPLDKPQGLF